MIKNILRILNWPYIWLGYTVLLGGLKPQKRFYSSLSRKPGIFEKLMFMPIQMNVGKVKMATLTIFRGSRLLKIALFYSGKSVKILTLQELLLWTQFLGYNGGVGIKILKRLFSDIIGHKLVERRSQVGQKRSKLGLIGGKWSKLPTFDHFWPTFD